MGKNTQEEKKVEKEYASEKQINCVKLKQKNMKVIVGQKAVVEDMEACNTSKNPHF